MNLTLVSTKLSREKRKHIHLSFIIVSIGLPVCVE